MGMLKKIGEISINTLSTIMEMTKEPGMKAIEKTVITAAPLIIKTIKNMMNDDTPMTDVNIKNDIDTKRSIGILNDTLGYETDTISYEIINYVNSISNSINKLLDELGEENVFIDELLLGYFIQKFNVPPSIVKKVERIIKNKYAIENLSLQDGNKILTSKKPKKKDMKTPGGVMKVDKNSKTDNDITNDLYNKKINKIITDTDDNKIKEFVGGM